MTINPSSILHALDSISVDSTACLNCNYQHKRERMASEAQDRLAGIKKTHLDAQEAEQKRLAQAEAEKRAKKDEERQQKR